MIPVLVCAGLALLFGVLGWTFPLVLAVIAMVFWAVADLITMSGGDR